MSTEITLNLSKIQEALDADRNALLLVCRALRKASPSEAEACVAALTDLAKTHPDPPHFDQFVSLLRGEEA